MDTKRQLARAVLAEIPEQLISYMRSKDYKPQNLIRKQSYKTRTELANNNTNTGEVGNSHTYSQHIRQPMASPSAPPYPYVWFLTWDIFLFHTRSHLIIYHLSSIEPF